MEQNQNKIDRKMFRELVERATKDKLSGLLTRGTAETYIANRLHIMKPEDSCAVMIIDLDDFKSVNDTLGHQVGDEVIIHTAKALSGSFRAGDIVSRWGGDEFLVFLSGNLTSDTVHDKASEISEKLQFIIGQNPGIAVSASIGIYIETTGQRSFRAMFQKADEALYSVKRTGKHGICIKMDEKLPEIREDNSRSMRPLQISELHEGLENGIALLEIGDEIQIIYVNHGICAMLNAPEGSFSHQRPLKDIIHPDDWPAVKKAAEDTAATGRNMALVVRVGKEGQWNWWNIKAARIRYPGEKPVLMMVSMDISNVKNSELQLQESNSMLREALTQMDSWIWEVDIPSRTFTLFQGTEKRKVVCRLAFPEGLVTSGLIAEESRDRLAAFADLLLKGVPGTGDNFLMEDPRTHQRRWASLTYNVASDANGRPLRAIGLLELLSRDSEEASDIFTVNAQMEGEDILFGMVCDLSDDSVKEFWYEGMNSYGQLDGTRCSELFRRISENVILEETDGSCADYFDLEKLKEMNRRGSDSFLIRFPYRLKDRRISLLYAGIMDLHPEDGHLYLSSYVNRMDRMDRIEQESGTPLESDPETGFLKMDSFERAAKALISEEGSGDSLCALAVMHLPAGSRRRACTAAAISLLDTRCLIGCSKDHEILLYFADIRSKAWLFDKLEKTLQYVRRIAGTKDSLRRNGAAAGVSCCFRSDAVYEQMYRQAADSCASWKNPYKDGIVFPEESDVWTWREISHTEESDRVMLHLSEIDRPLSAREKEAALACTTAMLRADTRQEAVNGALQAIGRFYEADRVYLLSLAEHDRIVVMSNEWSDMRRPSIQHAMSGMLTDRLPILRRCMKEKKPVYLTRRKPFADAADAAVPASPWHFTVFPLMRQDAVTGFLCIDNPKEHAADGALLYMVTPYIIKELRRLGPVSGSGAVRAEERSDYTDLYQLDFRRFQSIGLLCADLPNLSELSRQKGFEYRSRMLWYLAHEMENVFGRDNVYRVGPHEFAAVSPNTPRQVFLGRCLRLRARLQRVYPGECRIGSAYRQGMFYQRMLVDEARSAMYFNHSGLASVQQTIVIGGCSYGSVREAAEMDRLIVYVQPVIRRSDNAVAGAEVLVRGLDPSGSLVLPSRFLPALERNGSVRDLDLYVLGKTMEWMEQQVHAGKKVPDLSLNVSWQTLRHPSAFASFLAVQSRYPDAPEKTILLELKPQETEDFSSLHAIIGSLSGIGVRFLLDDVKPENFDPAWLDEVPAEAVKFERRCALNMDGKALRDAVDILEKRGIPWVMKGIETSDQAVRLEQTGCQYVQGFACRQAEPLSSFVLEDD